MPVTKTWPLAFSPSSVVLGTVGAGITAVRLDAPALRRVADLPLAGLRIPVGVNKKGGAAIVTGLVHDQKIIDTGLSGNDSLNAFQQDPGLGEDMVFDLSDPVVRGKIMIRLRDLFRGFELENRYKLLEDTIVWDEKLDTGELNLTFKYHNLETDDRKDFEKGFREGV